jgi:polysaccharide biosynthesis/export protein
MIAFKLIRAAAMIGFMLPALSGGIGCAHRLQELPSSPGVPQELSKQLLPEYVIEPPDILQIDALYVVPKPPYHVQSLDSLVIRVDKVIPDQPIAGFYQVEPDGTVNLGFSYGSVQVGGLTIPEVKAALEKHLKTATMLKDPQATVAIGDSRGLQQIRGAHLVRPDGTVSLGSYGSVQVTGLTLSVAKLAIEAQLSEFLQSPEVSVDVVAYNSKVFYVVYDGGGAGQQIYRLPITGNDTVLDAVSQLNGLSPVSDKNKIWVARRVGPSQPEQIMPVDWCGVTAYGRTETNYQLMPGDRIFVQADRFVTIDTRLARVFAPVERLFGITLLGVSTVRSVGSQNNTIP